IELTAIIQTALCVGAGGSSGSLADKAIARTATGQLLIPASQVKGRVRHECEKIARGLGWPVCDSPKADTMCPQRAGFPEEEEEKFHREDYRVEADAETDRHHCLICQIFGNTVLRSRVIFDDLICQEEPENLPEVLRPGVTINRDLRVAEDQKLFLLETSPPNLNLRFTGEMIFRSNCPKYAELLILAALRHINAFGGSKSSGLGWLKWELPSVSSDRFGDLKATS
ncbi:MAG: RAMP superfamily CRISPR-associated protein, partial [Cyanobacteriota bacterium]|nr:RAMP superfamily CRISPR-associated protein [Cyanobacteriota bacterium]